MNTFVDIVRERAIVAPNRLAYRFLRGRGEASTLTFAELCAGATHFAGILQSMSLRGKRVLLVCKDQERFVVAFYACLFAGAIAVPTAPPRRNHLSERLALVCRDAEISLIVTDLDDMLGILDNGDPFALPILDIRNASAAPPAYQPVAPTPNDVAFLQYTSGSTGDPKGVVVTHQNLISNSEAIREGMCIGNDSVILVGLPLFHDMGLIGGVLQSMFSDCSTTFMPPAELVQYPERWLRAISSFRVTVSGGPNFMYENAALQVIDSHMAGLDLSCWRTAFCGAEPVRAKTIERFINRFSTVGFCADAFYACYGMAEATLFITGGSPGKAPRVSHRHGAPVVSCGKPRRDTGILIVDPHTRAPVPDGEQGEIWTTGGSVALGYWGRGSLSDEVFRAYIDGSSTAYLRTGDLGWQEDGEIFVAGRLKDLIIINGRNLAPQDIEVACTAAHAAIVDGSAAAVSVDFGRGEEIVIIAELERMWIRREDEWPAVEASVRAAVFRESGVAVADIAFIRPGSLPRTSSGKVRRASARAAYQDRSLAFVSPRHAD